MKDSFAQFYTMTPLHIPTLTGLVIAVYISTAEIAAAAAGSQYCEGETFTPTCVSPDEVVMITQALYGRMTTNKCVPEQYAQALGCSANVLPYMDIACSGRPTCSVPVTNLIPYQGQGSCPSALRSYLQVTFICVKVTQPPVNISCPANSTAKVKVASVQAQGQGYLSSYVTEQTGCGSFDWPWILTASPGQRFSISMLDFTTNMTSLLGNGAAKACVVYATVKDGGEVGMTVCGGNGKRLTHVLTTDSNVLGVHLIGKLQQSSVADGYFLIKYAVEGCANPVLPNGAWLKRDVTSALIGCQSGGQAVTWPLQCLGSKWEGKVGVCSPSIAAADDVTPNVSAFQGISLAFAASNQHQTYSEPEKDLSIVLITGIAVCLSVTIISLAFLCIRRMLMKRNIPTSAAGNLRQLCIPHGDGYPLPRIFPVSHPTGDRDTLKTMTSLQNNHMASNYDRRQLREQQLYNGPSQYTYDVIN